MKNQDILDITPNHKSYLYPSTCSLSLAVSAFIPATMAIALATLAFVLPPTALLPASGIIRL